MSEDFDDVVCRFVQPSMGENIGATWDDVHDPPLVPKGTHDRIKARWKTEGSTRSVSFDGIHDEKRWGQGFTGMALLATCSSV